jgi:4-amino-4-deoxy-L-arabinose transferase-like glycosyltransferase
MGSVLVAAVAGLTLLGLAIRLANLDQSLFGDELSTYWIVEGHSLGDVVSSVRSDDEITPPLYFILAWLSLQVDSGLEWMRLPSLIAGTATIPLVYLLGMRTVSWAAGLVGAAVTALSPFMIYYSTEARSYALMIALLTASTLALLAALRGGRARWWGVYALSACGALYSHYTSVFPLAAQFAWVLWAHRDAIRALLLANLGVLIGFAPWIPGFIADTDSPTTEILSLVQPFTAGAVRLAVEQWAVGYPYVELDTVPGNVAFALIAAGLLIGAAAGALRASRWLRRSSLRLGTALRRIPPGIVLVGMLALATPLGEAVYSALGTNLLGARNLNASWPGLAVGIGGVVTAAGPALGLASAALVVSGFAIGGAKTLGSEVARPDNAAAADAIEDRWTPGDVVVDGNALTPVPLTALDVYLPQTHPEFRLGLPVSEHPFTLHDPVPSLATQIQEAFRDARGRSLFLVARLPSDALAGGTKGRVARLREMDTGSGALVRQLPPGFEVTDSEALQGLDPLVVLTIEDRGPRRR